MPRIAVAGEDLIGDLDGSAVDGVGRAKDWQDRDAFAQPKRASLVRGGVCRCRST
jgi:hypothetical protein